MIDMDLKTRAELLPCGTCEDMLDCDECYHRKEAQDIYQQIRAEVIESAYYIIKPFMSLEEWTEEVNRQIELKEQK